MEETKKEMRVLLVKCNQINIYLMHYLSSPLNLRVVRRYILLHLTFSVIIYFQRLYSDIICIKTTKRIMIHTFSICISIIVLQYSNVFMHCVNKVHFDKLVDKVRVFYRISLFIFYKKFRVIFRLM